MTIIEAMRTYRLPNPSTPEDLESRFSGMDGKMLTFSDKVVITGYYWNGPVKPCYYGAVYEWLGEDEIIGDTAGEDGTIPRMDADFRMMLEKLAGATTPECRSNPHFANMAVLALGDYYSSIAVFGLSAEQAADEAVTMAAMAMEKIEADKPLDSIEAAWQFTTNWVASNSAHFIGAPTQTMSLYAPREVSPIYGVIEGGKVYAIVDELNKALDAAGFSHVKSIKGFRRAGYIDTFTDSAGKQRSQTLKSIKKVSGRVYALNVKITGEEQGDDGPPPFSDPNDFPLGGQHSA